MQGGDSVQKIAVLTDEESWLYLYSQKFCDELGAAGYDVELFGHHDNVQEPFHVIFILSYFRLVPDAFLATHGHCLVVHESALPEGRGWAPYFWQILEGKNCIPVVLFEASAGVDTGDIYLEDEILLDGTELHDELRHKQAVKTFEMCQTFLDRSSHILPRKQTGESSHYRKRTPVDGELDIQKSIEQQFDLLRVVDNESYPAFFYHRGERYILNVFKDKSICE